MAYLRQPIISVLGHVDHGKTSLLDYIRKSKIISKEAGGITQHIGATEVSKKSIEKITKNILPANFIKIPGLLFIDTPGHKAFASLRKRGGSISDIGILVIDINEGFKPQTIEAVEILKSMKTPFIIAANKLDKINQFNSKPNTSLKQVLKEQNQECLYKIEEKIYEIVGEISKFDLDAERYDRVDDFTKKIAIIPISSLNGIGIPELISTLIGLTQKFMEKKITIENCNTSKGVILEVKDYVGLGKTYDIILYDGVMKSGDIIIAMDSFAVQTGKIKSILKPLELKEISDNSTKFKTIKEISASSGIKISAPDLIDIPAGMPIMTFRANEKTEIIEYNKSELEKEKLEITFTSKKEGILVKADTLGSLEAITNIFQEHNIPIRKARIGKITKTNIIDVSADLNLNPKNALVINFSQKIENEIIQMAKEYNVEIISSDIIYKLVEKANEWIEEKEKKIEREKLKNIIMPFKFKILTNHIFRTSNPAIIGIEVVGGTIKTNISLMTIHGKKIGKIKTIKDNKDNLKKLNLNQSGAVSIDNLIIGRHAQEESVIYSFMGEENFRNLKKNVNLLSRDEIQTLKEIAEIMRKEDTLWGL